MDGDGSEELFEIFAAPVGIALSSERRHHRHQHVAERTVRVEVRAGLLSLVQKERSIGELRMLVPDVVWTRVPLRNPPSRVIR
jgi:hypothetical protein